MEEESFNNVNVAVPRDVYVSMKKYCLDYRLKLKDFITIAIRDKLLRS